MLLYRPLIAYGKTIDDDIAKSKDTALAYLDKVLAIDSTNEDAVRIKKILTAPPPKRSTGSTASKSSSKSKAKTKSKSGSKPKSSAKKNDE